MQGAAAVVDHIDAAVAVQDVDLTIARAENMAGQLHVATADFYRVQHDIAGLEVIAVTNGTRTGITRAQLVIAFASTLGERRRRLEEIAAGEIRLVDHYGPVGNPALQQAIDIQVLSADGNIVAGHSTGPRNRAIQITVSDVGARVPAYMVERRRRIEDEVTTRADTDALCPNFAVDVDAAVTGSQRYVTAQVTNGPGDEQIRRRLLQRQPITEVITAAGRRVVAVDDGNLRCRRIGRNQNLTKPGTRAAQVRVGDICVVLH